MTWEYQIYLREHSAVFKYTKEKWGIFSNFYPEVLQVNGHVFPTSEHLYQAMKYPSYPQIQGEIMASITARKAKNTSRFHAQHQRPDWFEVNNKGHVVGDPNQTPTGSGPLHSPTRICPLGHSRIQQP